MLIASLNVLVFGLLSCTRSTTAASLGKRAPAPFTDFTKNEFFKPAPDANLWGTLYARSLQLPDESLLVTWENYPKEPPLVNHPIFRSVDGGATWSNYSAVYDQVNGWGMRFQPFLYTLPVPFAGLPAGTILAAGVSTRQSLEGGTWIELYYSCDQAKTFHFKSHVAYGDGPNTVKDRDKALWEPFILIYKGELVLYYSDSRDPNHSQKLVHTTTRDLVNWSPIVNDMVDPAFKGRPGMTVIAHIESRDKWIMTFEYCVTDGCRVNYKIANSPLEFDSVAPVQLRTTANTTAASGPYVIWTPDYNKNDGSGLVIVSGTNAEGVYVNSDDVPAGQWKLVPTNHWSAYSRSMRIIDIAGHKKLFFANGGNFGPKEKNGVACAVIEIPSLS